MKSDRPSDLARSTALHRVAGVLIVAVALFLGGCVNSTTVKIDSLAKPKAEESVSYKIVNKTGAADGAATGM
jgi:PBP1b-binding outer membrane lipoprotein LpoB